MEEGSTEHWRLHSRNPDCVRSRWPFLDDCLSRLHRAWLKNRPGGSKQLDLMNKVMKQFSNPFLGERCHVALVKKYLAKLLWKMIAAQRGVEAVAKHQLVHGMTTNQLDTTFEGQAERNVAIAGLQAETKGNHYLQAIVLCRSIRDLDHGKIWALKQRRSSQL